MRFSAVTWLNRIKLNQYIDSMLKWLLTLTTNQDDSSLKSVTNWNIWNAYVRVQYKLYLKK